MSGLFTSNFIYHPPEGFQARPWQTQFLQRFRQKLGLHREGQFVFTLVAGTGSGKTGASAMLAAELLNTGTVERVVYVCPNNLIAHAVREQFQQFGITLVAWDNAKHAGEGENPNSQGATITYASLRENPRAHNRLLRRKRTLVIFDEIHHLGDKQAWWQAAIAAFEHPNALILGKTGTPFRSDSSSIAFVTPTEPDSDGLRYFKSDYEYTLADSILDKHCKRPRFHWFDPCVELSVGNETRRYDYTDPPPDELLNRFLNAAVRHGSGSRRDALLAATTRCRNERRKLIIFLGGHSFSPTRPIEDATTFLPAELVALGIPREEIFSITSDPADPCSVVQQINKFRNSSAQILITVNMVSEGVDIPELSAALFLTSITATGTTIQRIGRVLRGCWPADALIFMFGDPRYKCLALQIENQINFAIRTRIPSERVLSGAGGGIRSCPILGRGESAREAGATTHGREYTQEQYEQAEASIQSHGQLLTDANLSLAMSYLFPAGKDSR